MSDPANQGLGAARAFPVFSIVFLLVYFFGFFTGFGPIRYYPAINQVTLAPLSGDVGPAMMWYGWIVNATLGGAVAAVLALLAPSAALEKLARRSLWIVPALGLVAAVGFIWGDWHFFTR